MATAVASNLQSLTINGDNDELYTPLSSSNNCETKFSNSSEISISGDLKEQEEDEEDNVYTYPSSSSSDSDSDSEEEEEDPPKTSPSTTFTPDDLTELSLLRELEIDLLVSSSLLPESTRFEPSLHDELVFNHPELILTITTGEGYPVLPLSWNIKNLTLSRVVVDTLRAELRKVIASSEYDEEGSLRRWMERDSNDNFGIYESPNLAFHLSKTTAEYLTTHRNTLASKSAADQPSSAPLNIKTQSLTRSQILSSESGIDLTSYTTPPTVKELLGKTIPQICETIPSNYRILHVENVLKPRLYADFHAVQTAIHERLLTLPTSQLKKVVPQSHHRRITSSGGSSSVLSDRREKESLAKYLTTPKTTYHGTSHTSIPSIIKHGFLRPGDINPSTSQPLQIRCGNTYGRGIYTSPSPQFALVYSGYDATPTPVTSFSGLKLIVCATVMGRPARVFRGDNWREQSKPYENSDSHVANGDFEYIVFMPRQCIPVLVVHLDWGKEHYMEFVNIPTNPLQWIMQMAEKRKVKKFNKKKREEEEEAEKGGLFPADVVRRKQALMARALKWFPYGFGPATGTRFVVEAVADDSDDEEEYGEYQVERAETGGVYDTSDRRGGSFWEEEMEGERFDEFFEERRAKAGEVKASKEVESEDED
ncbi:hypothetical protein TWF730_004290 [Orbilia blumenaviensis]|uniref:PARP catalytic domain-containing protein n=1 Tax=Orbilia blumenaviensis TaxID=1796055 RepID=A0AAV9U095_9PEZI